MSPKLNVKLSHKITINSLIKTFISFLPLNRVEYVEKLQNEVESNPMLEIESTEPTGVNKDESNYNVIKKKT